METETSYAMDGIKIGLTILFILLNAFFVASEFALVKVTKGKLKGMIKEKKPFANMAMWLYKRQNLALSACQLGITMASLALGWIGEPAIAHLITPIIKNLGVTSDSLIHGIAFTIAFSLITSLHIVIGEQVPKIYAIRKPGKVFLGTALILKGFYRIFYPFMYILNTVTNFFLKLLGIIDTDAHETSLTEEEIRGSLSIAHAKGELSSNEHYLLNAVFRFDDEVANKIMIPRNEVEFLEVTDSLKQTLKKIKNSRFSRLPLCDGSLDKLVGVIHIKNMFGFDGNEDIELASLARSPMLIPEKMLIGKLLQEFRIERQHFAFVQDEHGTILGIVTLEDVLEELVGDLQDEFDNEHPEMIKQPDGKYLVEGDVMIDEINEKFNIELVSQEADTISGLIVEKLGHKLKPGIKLKIVEGVEVEIITVEGIRATRVQLSISNQKKETS